MIVRYKYKKDRRLLQNTFGSTESSFNKKKYKPGMHKSTRPYATFYGKLLNQRQKLKAFYANLKNRQLKKLIQRNLNHKNYKEKIIITLESRIDTVLFRSGLVKSFGLARQLINHKHVTYENKYITSPSQQIKTSTPIVFSDIGLKIIKNNIKKIGRSAPTYINVKPESLEIIVDTNCIPKKESELRFATKISLDEVIRSYKL